VHNITRANSIYIYIVILQGCTTPAVYKDFCLYFTRVQGGESDAATEGGFT